MEAYNNLLNFGDIYKSRRKREAEYLKAALNSGISGVRVYSLKNLFDLGVDS